MKGNNKQIKTGESGDNIDFINTLSDQDKEDISKSVIGLVAAAEKLKKSESQEVVTKKEFYNKLLKKLQKIESGEMTLSDYIAEVKQKVEKYA